MIFQTQNMAGDTNGFESKSVSHIDHRLRGRPSVVSFEELNVGNSSIRELAVYSCETNFTKNQLPLTNVEFSFSRMP